MKNDACLARLAEVQIVPYHDVEKIVRSQRTIRRRLNVIAGDKELLPTVRRSENGRLRVVGAVGKKLQS